MYSISILKTTNHYELEVSVLVSGQILFKLIYRFNANQKKITTEYF